MVSNSNAVSPPKRSLLGFIAGSRTEHEAKEAHQGSSQGAMRHRMRGKAPPPPVVSSSVAPALVATSSRAAHASCCSRCVGFLSSHSHDRVVHCSACGDSMHAQCTYPPLPDVVCTPEETNTWVCEPCLQDQILQGLPAVAKYPFCMQCAEDQKETWRIKDDLVACVSCRASYHRTCAGLSDEQNSLDWTCRTCSGRRGEHIRLRDWSLELVQQQNGRMIPVVRGAKYRDNSSPGSLWRTSEIVHALTPTKLITRKSMVIQLSGPLSISLAKKLNLPKYLMVNFKSGFPLQSWMSLVRYARCLPPPTLKAALSLFDYEPDLTPLSIAEKGVGLSCFKDNRRHAKRGGGETNQSLQKRQRLKQQWTAADVLLLQNALRSVRPSTPHFWQQVAGCVGKPAAECQARAFGPVTSHSSDKQCREGMFKRTLGNGMKNQTTPTELGDAPKKDGPRRAKCVRTFLNARCFGRGRDFLHAPPQKTKDDALPVSTPPKHAPETDMLKGDSIAPPETDLLGGDSIAPPETDLLKGDPLAPPDDILKGSSIAPLSFATDIASPKSIQFLDSLHTGCTPTSGQKMKRVATPFSMASSSLLAKSSAASYGLDDDGDDNDTALSISNTHLDLGDSTWQPIGLDSFICEARDRRNKLARSGNLWAARTRMSPHASGTGRAKMRRASGLFRKVNASAKAMDATPKSVASESEDELAPVAAIPLYTGGNPWEVLP